MSSSCVSRRECMSHDMRQPTSFLSFFLLFFSLSSSSFVVCSTFDWQNQMNHGGCLSPQSFKRSTNAVLAIRYLCGLFFALSFLVLLFVFFDHGSGLDLDYTYKDTTKRNVDG